MPNKKPRKHVTYDLKKGNEIVYRGSTNNPDRREQDHRQEGKFFDKLVITSRSMTSEGAKKKESENLERYRKSHGGKNPKYNKDNDG